jgi:hypothetical protein
MGKIDLAQAITDEAGDVALDDGHRHEQHALPTASCHNHIQRVLQSQTFK